MKNIFENMPESFKGALSMAIGFVLLLHTFNIFKELLNYILMFFGLYLIIVGFARMGGFEWIKKITVKKHSKKQKKPKGPDRPME